MQPPLEDDMPPLEDDPSFPDDMPALIDAPTTVEEPRAFPRGLRVSARDDEMFIMDEIPPEMIGDVRANANPWLITRLSSGISTMLYLTHYTAGG